jgi:hypothetical protein
MKTRYHTGDRAVTEGLFHTAFPSYIGGKFDHNRQFETRGKKQAISMDGFLDKHAQQVLK